jgi:hypothetical protein
LPAFEQGQARGIYMQDRRQVFYTLSELEKIKGEKGELEDGTACDKPEWRQWQGKTGFKLRRDLLN